MAIPAALAAAAALALAGCGSSASGPSTSADAGAHTVSVRHVAGAGDVLVDRAGRTLYSPAQEARGRLLCTGTCTSFWVPVTASGALTGGPGVGRLAVVKRPDGERQVTVDGAPAYTFVRDRPGRVTGQGAQDRFGGHLFTWHALTAAGGEAAPATGGKGGYSY